ncbi:hypothetical protein CPB86DRAFT_623050 [Serendipita vermifera]|nr:hypothetical protein CPB86DRAFT_623050 [Serendipita vermifera]
MAGVLMPTEYKRATQPKLPHPQKHLQFSPFIAFQPCLSSFYSPTTLFATRPPCDSLGIHYNIAKEKFGLNAVRRVEKWDKETNQNVLVAEFKLPGFGLDKIKWPGDTDWRPMSEFLAMSSEAFSYS